MATALCHHQPLGREGSGGIERMAGLTLRRQTQAQQPALAVGLANQTLPHQLQQLPVAAAPGTLVPPPQPDGGPAVQGPLQPAIVVGPHRIGSPPEQRGAGADAGKQVEHRHRTKPPLPRKTDDPAQGWIIPLGIGTGGVQTDEHQGRQPRLPLPPQPPAIVPAGAQGGVRAGYFEYWH